MKVDVEELSPVEVKLLVEIPAERVDDEIELAYKDVNKRARIPGFRPGKIPRKQLERKFKDYVEETVMSKLMQETVKTALERKQLNPVSEPRVEPGEFRSGEPFSYTLRFEVRPKVEARNYKGLKTFQEIFTVTEDMVEDALAEIQERHAVFKDPEPPRPARMSDYLVMDISATHDGESFSEEKHDNVRYPLGEEAYIPDLASHLEGVETGDTRTFSVSFPEDHPREHLAGKDVEYTVYMKDIKEKILPELDDEFAKETGGYETLEELRIKTREHLEEYHERLSRSRFENRLMEIISEDNPFPVPPSMVTRHAQELAAGGLQRMGLTKISQEQFQAIAEKFRERAEKELRAGLLLDAMARQENIEVTDQDMDARIEEMAGEQGIHPDKMRDRLADEESRSRLRSYILEQKTLDFLANNAKIEKRDVDVKELQTVPDESLEIKEPESEAER